MLKKGYQCVFAYTLDATKAKVQLTNILVVLEFSDVFSNELPGEVPNREVEFRIDLVPKIAPISIPPY